MEIKENYCYITLEHAAEDVEIEENEQFYSFKVAKYMPPKIKLKILV